MESSQRKQMWEESEKLFIQVTLHRIPTFPQNTECKFEFAFKGAFYHNFGLRQIYIFH